MSKVKGKAKVSKYPCLFDFTENCPIRKHVKLKPESLVDFCEICYIRIKKLKEKNNNEK